MKIKEHHVLICAMSVAAVLTVFAAVCAVQEVIETKKKDKVRAEKNEHLCSNWCEYCEIKGCSLSEWTMSQHHRCEYSRADKETRKEMLAAKKKAKSTCELQINHCKNCDTDMFRKIIVVKGKDEIVYDCKCKLTDNELLERKVRLLEQKLEQLGNPDGFSKQ